MCIRDRHKPVNKITVKEICERAELNRATFYAHYSDCFDLLESIEEELFGQFERSMQSYIHSVSYTHLDVYKRQVSIFMASSA